MSYLRCPYLRRQLSPPTLDSLAPSLIMPIQNISNSFYQGHVKKLIKPDPTCNYPYFKCIQNNIIDIFCYISIKMLKKKKKLLEQVGNGEFEV